MTAGTVVATRVILIRIKCVKLEKCSILAITLLYMAVLDSWCRIPIHNTKTYTRIEAFTAEVKNCSCDFTHFFQWIFHNFQWIRWFLAFEAKTLNKWPLLMIVYYWNENKLHIRVFGLPQLRDMPLLRWTLLCKSTKTVEFLHMIELDAFEASKCPWSQNMFEHFGTDSWWCTCTFLHSIK